MTKVMLSLPEPLSRWVEEQAANNNFATVGDYVENLLSEERARQDALAEFDRLIQEGEDSGVSDRTFEDILAEARKEAQSRFFHAKL